MDSPDPPKGVGSLKIDAHDLRVTKKTSSEPRGTSED